MGERDSPLDVSALGITLEGVRYAPAQRRIVVDAPMNVSLAYIAIYSGRAFDYFGVPAPLSIAVLKCGEAQAVAVAGPLGYFNASLQTNVVCSAHLYKSPVSPYAVAVAALALYLAKLFRERNLY
nr:MAG: hypothetical protein TU35_06055 [Thermoproteus sp. AZ2]